MVPPEDWSTNSLINYLKGIEISQFYERFKFTLLVSSKDGRSFYGHIDNIDTQNIFETHPHLTNYFSLGGSNNTLTVKDEVDIYIVQHNVENTIVRFAPNAHWAYKPSNIDYTTGNIIRVEYMKTQTDSNLQIQQGGELPTINIITANNANSSLRIDFGVGDSYVINPGQKTLNQDNAIILDAEAYAIISSQQLIQLNNQLYLSEIEVEEVILFFDDKDELILIHPKRDQILCIKGNKNEVQFLFKNTNSYEIYPSVDYTTFLKPGEYTYDLANNPYIILREDIPHSLIVKILVNEQDASIHNIVAFTQQRDVLTLSIGQHRLTIFGWDSNKLLRPIFLFKNNVSLNLNNFDTSDITQIKQFIKIQSKLAVIEHQLPHFSTNIEILDKIAFTLGNKDNEELEEGIDRNQDEQGNVEADVEDNPVAEFLFIEALLEFGVKDTAYASSASPAGGSSIINNVGGAFAALLTRVKNFANIAFLKLPEHVEFESQREENSSATQHTDLVSKDLESFSNNYKQSKYQFVINGDHLLFIENDNVQYIASLSNSAIFPEENGWLEQNVYRGCHNSKAAANKQYLINNIKDNTGIHIILSHMPNSVCIDFHHVRPIKDQTELPSWVFTCRKPQSLQDLLLIPKDHTVDALSNLSDNTSCLAQIINGYNITASIIPFSNDQYIIKNLLNTAVVVITCSAASLVPLPTIPILSFVPSANNYFNLIKHYLPEDCSHKDAAAALGTVAVIGATLYSPAIHLMLSARTVYEAIKSLMPEFHHSDQLLTSACIISGVSSINIHSIIDSGPVQVTKGLSNLQYLSAIWSTLQIVKPHVIELYDKSRSYFTSKTNNDQKKHIENFIEELNDLDLTPQDQETVNNISGLLAAQSNQMENCYIQLQGQLKEIGSNYFFDAS